MESNITEYQGYNYTSFVLFDFELNHDRKYHRQWMADNWHISLYLIGIYFTAIIVLKEYMKNRQQFNMKRVLIVWNVGLALFSFCGMYRTIPELVYVLRNHGFKTSVCNNTVNNVMGFWGWIFAFSKAVELFETLFFILMKRQVTPLQVIHHVLTLVLCWYNFRFMPSLGRWTVGINFTIHTMMYSYFAVKSLNVFVPEWVPLFITRAQIIQFGVGLYASMYGLVVLLTGGKCNNSLNTTLVYAGSYIWMMYLFVNFYIQRYIKKGAKKID